MRLCIVFGTRPEIIKLSKIMRLAKGKRGMETILVNTGQHYSSALSRQFLEELEIPRIDYTLGIGSKGPGTQVGEILIRLERILEKEEPDYVVVEGDTNSVLGGAIAANKATVKLAHVEAGLRSFDWRMPEEHNRIVADHLSELCFAPTRMAEQNMLAENIPGQRIRVVGNTIVEVTREGLKSARRSRILAALALEPETYMVATAHRTENVDVRERLKGMLNGLSGIPCKVIYPLHPRTEKNIKRFGLEPLVRKAKNIVFTEPLGYRDFLALCANSCALLTDSGGMQEEASIYKRPVLILRDNTERPEILGTFGKLVGTSASRIEGEAKRVMANYASIKKRLEKIETPFGDGKASERILHMLRGEKH